MTLHAVQFELKDEYLNYLESSARLRRISRTALVKKIIEIVAKDQLILSVLDDAQEIVDKTPRPKRKYTRRQPAATVIA